MKELRHSIIPLPYDWKPKRVMQEVEAEAKKWWDEGWVVVEAKPDRLLESILISFERRIFAD